MSGIPQLNGPQQKHGLPSIKDGSLSDWDPSTTFNDFEDGQTSTGSVANTPSTSGFGLSFAATWGSGGNFGVSFNAGASSNVGGAVGAAVPSYVATVGAAGSVVFKQTASGSGTTTNVTVGVAGGVTFNLEFINADGPTSNFMTDVENAALALSKAMAGSETLNISIGYGEVGGTALSNGSAAAGPSAGLYESYSTVRAALIAHDSSGDPNASAFNDLPTGSTIDGYSQVAVWNAELKSLGLMSGTNSALDGEAGFAKGISDSLMVGVALHELTHAMGRAPTGGTPDVFDLFRYTSAGNILVSSATPSTPAYFSTNGGVTSLTSYGISSDPSDFLNSTAPNDPFSEYYSGGTGQTLSSIDLAQMDVLGFNVHAAAHVAPTVNVKNVTVSAGAAVSESAFFTGITNPSGDSITQYGFWDGGGDGGHIAINGVAQSDGAWTYVAAANLGTVTYVAGASAGAEPLYVEAYDATTGSWTAYAGLTETTHVAPTLTVKNVTVNANAAVSETAFFTGVSNPSGDSITQYEFWDGGNDGGHISVNGVAQTDGHWIAVTAAQLSTVTYVGAPTAGSESLYVTAYDATTASWLSTVALTAATHATPTVTVKNVTVAANTAVSEAAFFTGVANANGDSFTQYGFWDAGGDNGHLSVAGATQTDGHWVDVTAAQLASVAYVGGPSPGSENLYVEAYDATTKSWTAYAGLTATTSLRSHAA